MPPMQSGLGNLVPPTPGKKALLGMAGAMLMLLVCFGVAFMAFPSEGAPTTRTPGATGETNASAETIAATLSLTTTQDITPTVTPIVPITTTAAAPVTPTVAPTLPCTFIKGVIYNDANANRVKDEGEAGINGASIQLQTPDGAVVSFAVTDDQGAYQMLNPPFGAYRVRVAAPPGFTPTTPPELSFNLAGCSGFEDLNFGFNQPQQLPTPIGANPTQPSNPGAGNPPAPSNSGETNPPSPTPVVIVATAAPPPDTPTPIILIVTSTPLPPSPTPIIVTAVPPPPTATFTPTQIPSPTPTPTPEFFITGATAQVAWTDCPSVGFDGTITASGQGTAVFQWEHENGSTTPAQTLTFFASGTLPVPPFERNIEDGGAFGTNGWVRLKVLLPNPVESNQAVFQFICDSDVVE